MQDKEKIRTIKEESSIYKRRLGKMKRKEQGGKIVM